MTMNEKRMNSIIKEIEKLAKSLERYRGVLEKKIEKCNKFECNWTKEEFLLHRDNDMTEKQWDAYFCKTIAEHDVEDTESRIENAEKRLAKITGKVEADMEVEKQRKEIDSIENAWLSRLKEEVEKTPEQRKEEYKEWLRQFKADCLKDGIIINEASNICITGNTPLGKRFSIYINNGFTERSFYCYTLKIDGQTIFTSGTFGTCYIVVKGN